MIPQGRQSHGVAAVAIGRNEGERLVRCLTALLPLVDRVIYVDSGSTDGSVERAEALGATVVRLDMSRPFTAARARNAGLAEAQSAEFVQFIDGDCVIAPGWLDTAQQALETDPSLGAVAGRRRERFPDASVYNLICDVEWNTPVGPARAIGGDILIRRSAIEGIGGFDPTLIAGEEPEMCLRLARGNWKIARLDAEMTLHDANMTQLRQWWKRSRRAGHAFAEVSWRYRGGDEGFWKRETLRPLIWSMGVPLGLIAAGMAIGPVAAAGLLLYPAQIAKMALRDAEPRERWPRAVFNMIGKLPETMGVIEYHVRRLTGKQSGLIEYK